MLMVFTSENSDDDGSEKGPAVSYSLALVVSIMIGVSEYKRLSPWELHNQRSFDVG